MNFANFGLWNVLNLSWNLLMLLVACSHDHVAKATPQNCVFGNYNFTSLIRPTAAGTRQWAGIDANLQKYDFNVCDVTIRNYTTCSKPTMQSVQQATNGYCSSLATPSYGNWSLIHNGVSLKYASGGDSCSPYLRSFTIYFVCNNSNPNPLTVFNVSEFSVCNYSVVLPTILACSNSQSQSQSRSESTSKIPVRTFSKSHSLSHSISYSRKPSQSASKFTNSKSQSHSISHSHSISFSKSQSHSKSISKSHTLSKSDSKSKSLSKSKSISHSKSQSRSLSESPTLSRTHSKSFTRSETKAWIYIAGKYDASYFPPIGYADCVKNLDSTYQLQSGDDIHVEMKPKNKADGFNDYATLVGTQSRNGFVSLVDKDNSNQFSCTGWFRQSPSSSIGNNIDKETVSLSLDCVFASDSTCTIAYTCVDCGKTDKKASNRQLFIIIGGCIVGGLIAIGFIYIVYRDHRKSSSLFGRSGYQDLESNRNYNSNYSNSSSGGGIFGNNRKGAYSTSTSDNIKNSYRPRESEHTPYNPYAHDSNNDGGGGGSSSSSKSSNSNSSSNKKKSSSKKSSKKSSSSSSSSSSTSIELKNSKH